MLQTMKSSTKATTNLKTLTPLVILIAVSWLSLGYVIYNVVQNAGVVSFATSSGGGGGGGGTLNLGKCDPPDTTSADAKCFINKQAGAEGVTFKWSVPTTLPANGRLCVISCSRADGVVCTSYLYKDGRRVATSTKGTLLNANDSAFIMKPSIGNIYTAACIGRDPNAPAGGLLDQLMSLQGDLSKSIEIVAAPGEPVCPPLNCNACGDDALINSFKFLEHKHGTTPLVGNTDGLDCDSGPKASKDPDHLYICYGHQLGPTGQVYAPTAANQCAGHPGYWDCAKLLPEDIATAKSRIAMSCANGITLEKLPCAGQEALIYAAYQRGGLNDFSQMRAAFCTCNWEEAIKQATLDWQGKPLAKPINNLDKILRPAPTDCTPRIVTQ